MLNPNLPSRRFLGSRKPLEQISTNLASRPSKHLPKPRHPAELESANDSAFENPDSSQQLSDDGLIRHHFDLIDSDVPSGPDTVSSRQFPIYSDDRHLQLHVVEEEVEEAENLSDWDDENAVAIDATDAALTNEVEDDEDDDDDARSDITDYEGPQEPKWNRRIFNELQSVMQKYSKVTLDENDEDTYDVTMVAEYAPEVINYLHELEHRYAADPDYMSNQDELKWEMRGVLIDWIVQVHQRFNLLPETLFLTVNYVDRFLSRRRVSLSRFQLVGAVALFIAAKYEEINCPTVQEVAYMADNAYSIEDFLKAERFMIDVLEFDMGWPGPMSFLRRVSKADDYDYETRTLAKYFLEITIMDHRFVASQPSWLAAGAHYLLRKMLNKGHWTNLHVFYSGYTEEQLKPLARIYMEMCLMAELHHKAIFEKYQERRYRRSLLFVHEFLRAMKLLSPKE